MSVIDSLVISLSLDPKGMTDGQKQAVESLRKFEHQAQQTGERVEQSGDKAAAFFSSVRREALGMFAVFTAGRSLKAFVGDITESNAQLGYLSQRLGMAPRQLYQMEQAAAAAGGSIGEIGATFASVQQKLLDPQQRGNVANTFRFLGVNDFFDPKTQNMRGDILARLNQAVHQNHMQGSLVQAYMSQLGFGQGAINEVLMDPAAFKRLQDQLRGLGPTPGQIQHSQQLMQDWTVLKAQTEATGRTILDYFYTPMHKVMGEMTALEKAHPGAVETLAGIAAGAIGAGVALKVLSTSFAAVRGLTAMLSGGSFAKVAEAACACQGGGGPARTAERVAEGAGEAGIARGGIGVLKRLVLPVALGAAAWEATQPGGRLEEKALSYTPGVGVDARVIRWLFGDKRSGVQGLEARQFAQYADSVGRIEHARYDQMGGSSGRFAGRYQMSQDAIAEAAQRLREQTPTRYQFLHDPAMQERYFEAYTALNGEYLQTHSEAFRKASTAQKLGVLAYAHNQGAAGAARWLQTGVAGHDAFGTSGAQYYQAVQQAMRESAPAPTPAPSFTHNGDITIHTQATDAKGIAHDIRRELRKTLPTQNMNGLT